MFVSLIIFLYQNFLSIFEIENDGLIIGVNMGQNKAITSFKKYINDIRIIWKDNKGLKNDIEIIKNDNEEIMKEVIKYNKETK